MAARTPQPEARAVTTGPYHHFFGYYDKCPWNSSQRYLLALRATFMDRPPTAQDLATVGLVDLAEGNRWIFLAETPVWNWQQANMLQWLPTAPDRLVIHNDLRENRYVSVVHNIHTRETWTIPFPIYAVSRDGKFAVSANFSRIHRTRPGYGYACLPDAWAGDPHPKDDGIYLVELDTGQHRLIISVAQIAEIGHDPSMDDGHHWFNHLQFNTNDTRFVFLHRWRVASGGFRTRMFTASPDGTDIFCVADHRDYNSISHFDWRDDAHILAVVWVPDVGDRYCLFTDRTCEVHTVGESTLTCDGHCSYSPDRDWILSDTYPDEERMRTLFLYRPQDDARIQIGRFFSPAELKGEIRCDLHPRWSRDGQSVCFDSVHEGTRQVYVVDVSGILSGRLP